MCGLLVRSHMNAGQDGFRSTSPQQSRPMVRGTASLECNNCRWQFLEAAQLLAKHRLLGGIDAVQLKQAL